MERPSSTLVIFLAENRHSDPTADGAAGAVPRWPNRPAGIINGPWAIPMAPSRWQSPVQVRRWAPRQFHLHQAQQISQLRACTCPQHILATLQVCSLHHRQHCRYTPGGSTQVEVSPKGHRSRRFFRGSDLTKGSRRLRVVSISKSKRRGTRTRRRRRVRSRG